MVNIEMANGKNIKIELYPTLRLSQLQILKSLLKRAFMTDLFFIELSQAL